jgi:hypothetical protein
MKALILITYVLAMALIAILRARATSAEVKLVFILSYISVSTLVSIFSPFGLIETLVLLTIPVMLVLIFDRISGKITFRFLFIFTNLIVLGLVTNLDIYMPEITLFMFILISIFLFLPYKKGVRNKMI